MTGLSSRTCHRLHFDATETRRKRIEIESAGREDLQYLRIPEHRLSERIAQYYTQGTALIRFGGGLNVCYERTHVIYLTCPYLQLRRYNNAL